MKKFLGLIGMIAIMTFISMLLVAGCGGQEDADISQEEPDGETAVEDYDDDEVIQDEDTMHFESEQYILPETFADFVATFKEIQYTGGNVGGEKTIVHYKFLGTEEINGIQSDKIEFSVGGEGLFTLWVDGDGTIQKAIADGEEIPAEMAQMLAEPVKNAAMAPFYHASQFDIENIFSKPVPGYEQKIVGTETESFGDITATVYTIEISVGPPAVEENLSTSATLRIADLGEFKMLTYWETTEAYEGGSKGILTIDEFILR